MSNMAINSMRKPQAAQVSAQKPQAPSTNQAQKPDLSSMYSQVAQNAMKTKPHH